MSRDLEIRSAASFSVFEQFRSFWKEVETQRDATLSRVTAPPAVPGSTALTHPPTAVRDRLIAFLRGQEAEIARQGKPAALDYYRQAQYAMVAAADEVFVRMPWSGAWYWASNLLETERFGTRRAGEAVFGRIERLVQQAHPAEKELAAVYLTALALGFQGRYADSPDSGAIEHYKRQLYELIFEKRPDLTDPFRKLLPECYESTIAAGTGRKLRSPRVWWWAAAGVVVVWLVVSHLMWSGISRPLYKQMNEIQRRTGQMEPVK